MLRKIKYSFLFTFGVPAIYYFQKIIARTLRININEPAILEKIKNSPETWIFAFWHCDMIAITLVGAKIGLAKEKKFYVLASQSRDGELLARTVKRLGVDSVRGSSSRGGAEGLRQLKEKLLEKANVAIAVDGPLGPRQVVKSGVIMLARASGAPIFPVAIKLSKKIVAGSWDRTEIPLPFCRAQVNLAPPITIPSNISPAQLEEFRQQLQATLLQLKNLT